MDHLFFDPIRDVETLLRNAAFLVVLMPVVGALLVAASARLGVEAARRTAQANALVTALLAVAMAVNYASVQSVARDGRSLPSRPLPWLAVVEPAREAEAGTTDAVSSAAPRGRPPGRLVGPSVWAAFAVDGLNVWFVVLSGIGMFPVLASGPREGPGGAGCYVLLLLLQSCLLGTYLAADAALFVFCAEAALLPVFLIIGGWGGFERRAAAVRWLVFQGAAGGAILTGVVLLVLAARWTIDEGPPQPVTFSIPHVVAHLAHSGHVVWASTAPWALFLLAGGFLARSAVFPLHTWFVPSMLEGPPALGVLFVTSGVQTGLYGLVRFVIPVFPPEWLVWGATLGVAGFVFASLLVLAQGNLMKFAACATLGHAAACLAGAATTTSAGVTGSVLFATHQGAAVGLLVYVVGWLQRRYETCDVEAFGGLARSQPRLAALFGLAVLALAGCPGGSGFPSGLLVVKGIFARSGSLAAWFLLGGLLLAWAMLWNVQRLLLGRRRMPLVERAPGDDGIGAPPVDLAWGEFAAALPLVVFVIWLGVWPRTFVDVTARSAARVHDIGTIPATASDDQPR